MNDTENGASAGNTDMIAAGPGPDAENRDGFLVVGIGASAGGIDALRAFFENVPADSNIAYVVILHLSPDHESHLAEVLQTVSHIPVTQVAESVVVSPNNVYVVPPNRHLTMAEGTLNVTPNLEHEDRRAPVDIFFRTLADSLGPRAVAVVLSGTGADGSMGIKRVKEYGGATFVQNPRESAFAEMPRSSISTEVIDEVLPVADIPAKIIAYRDQSRTIRIPPDPDDRPEGMEMALREVLTQLRTRTGHDFSNYKRATLLRRIERRINVRELPDLPSYADYIRERPDETNALLKDLLISVTNFFRDQEAFAYLENVILPAIFSKKPAEGRVRIWVAGCATGEEAYSLAMLCAERTMGMLDAPKVQIFATDIDGDAIATAREGLYTLNDAADVSSTPLNRFFTKEGDRYRVRRELREIVMFANHNVLKDPPFSHLDLVTCRNLLIYLNNIAKARAIETFHFALEPGAYLFLGSSETVEDAGDLYAPKSQQHHIYQSRHVGIRSYPVPESTPVFHRDIRPAVHQPREKRSAERITYGQLHQQLVERYAPPSVVVNEQFEVVHLSDRAGRYMQVPGGEPSTNLLSMVLPELRLELTTALYQASQQQADVDARGVSVQIGDRVESINIRVRPVLGHEDTSRGFILVLFEPAPADEAPARQPLLTSDEPLAHQLEEELSRSRSQLRTTSEQYEVQAEELKASNEELQAMNEELRSAAEELETSKEELQSINEELRTVNQELKIKVEETTVSRNNLMNLMNSTNIATIFLDRLHRVQLFTPAATELFNLISADFGRPITDITHKLEYEGIVTDAESVLETLLPVEREVKVSGGHDFQMRIRPYRTDDARINGVVLTFVDITDRKRAQRILEQQTEELSRFNDAMVGREERMVELKQEVNGLCERLGESRRYSMEFDG